MHLNYYGALILPLVLLAACESEPECRQPRSGSGRAPGPSIVETASFHDGSCTPSSYSTYKYNEQGKPMNRRDYSAWTDQEEEVIDYYYDEEGRLRQVIEHNTWTDEANRRLDYTYGDNGLLRSVYEFERPYGNEIREYDYDNEGRRIEERTLVVADNGEVDEVRATTRWFYDEDGRVVERTVDQDLAGPNDGLPNIKCVYRYLSQVTEIRCDGGMHDMDGVADEITHIRYDVYGQVIQKTREGYIWIRGSGNTQWTYLYQ
ncbi:MAG: hypothetical protein JKY56_17835 [Kofleriaceae bacterium]|nr:hypothetical protein [Kofleriaceae bacterium]